MMVAQPADAPLYKDEPNHEMDGFSPSDLAVVERFSKHSPRGDWPATPLQQRMQSSGPGIAEPNDGILAEIGERIDRMIGLEPEGGHELSEGDTAEQFAVIMAPMPRVVGRAGEVIAEALVHRIDFLQRTIQTHEGPRSVLTGPAKATISLDGRVYYGIRCL